MAESINTQDIVNAKRDIEDIGKAVNEVAIVSPRYGEDFKSLPMIAAEGQAIIDGLDASAQIKFNEWDSAIALITQEGGVPALAVSDASGLTQQEVNNGVDSIADLLAIPNPKNGMRVYVKSYIAGAGKGAGTYVYDSAKSGISDGVLCINGWCLASTPDIFSGGVLADGSDDTVALQRTYDALHSIGMDIDLLGNTIKTISLDIDSNTVIKNGTLDVYDWNGSVDFPDSYPESNWRRTPIMLKNNPRYASGDYEYANRYTALALTKSITFRNLKFKAKRRLFTAYKLDELLIEGCDFEWESGEIINVIGGWQGTTYVSDTDNTTNILTPVNGYCENIKIKNNKFRSLTPSVMSSATHFVATRNLTVCNNEYYNVPLGSRIDTWNTEVDVFGNKYLFTDPDALAFLDSDSAAIDSDYIGVYIGQNTYNVNIHGNTFDGVYRPIYVEVGSHVDIWDNSFKNRIGKRWWSYAIVLQGNWRDYDNVFWGNTSFVTVRENKFVGFGTAVANSTALPAGRSFGHMGIIVKDNTIIGYSGQGSLLLNRTLDLICTNNIVEGYAIIDNIGGIQIVSGNNINHQGTDVNAYPLTISNSKGAFFDATRNTIRSNIGACVRLVNTAASLVNLGGSLLIPSATINFVSQSNPGGVIGIISTPYKTSFIKDVLINLADEAVGVYTVAIPNLRANDIVSVSMSGLTGNWTSYGIGLDFEYEPTAGNLNLRVKNISGKLASLTVRFLIHFQVNMTPL